MLSNKSMEKLKEERQLLNVEIIRGAKITTHPFMSYFKGFEKIEAVKSIFGEETKDVLSNLRIECIGRRGYMGVSGNDGHLIISAYYLNNGDIVDIYLDIIHELVHVKQFMEGKTLFDRNFRYVERPTEIEAYMHAVREARKLGMDDRQILEYLKTEWMSEEDLIRLAKAVKVKVNEN
jgi:hypothetical protein